MAELSNYSHSLHCFDKFISFALSVKVLSDTEVTKRKQAHRPFVPTLTSLFYFSFIII